jgi:hypothetical protein
LLSYVVLNDIIAIIAVVGANLVFARIVSIAIVAIVAVGAIIADEHDVTRALPYGVSSAISASSAQRSIAASSSTPTRSSSAVSRSSAW